MTSSPPLSIVLPSYNYGRCVPATIDHIQRTCPAGTEVIVVIDGSTDGSLALLQNRSWPKLSVRILSHPVRRGKGVAVREGVRAARGHVIAFIDADRAIEPAVVARALKRLQQDPTLDAVIGRRRHYRTSLTRHLAHSFFHWITFLLFRMPFHDTQAPMKIFRASIAKAIFRRMQTSSYAFDIEALFRAQALGAHVEELAVTQRKTSSSMRWSMLPFTFLELLHIYRTYIAWCVIRLFAARRKTRASADLWSLRHILLWPFSWPALWILQGMIALLRMQKHLRMAPRSMEKIRPFFSRSLALR